MAIIKTNILLALYAYFELASLAPAPVSGAGRSSVRNNLSLESWLSLVADVAEEVPAEVGRPDRERRNIRIVSPAKGKNRANQ